MSQFGRPLFWSLLEGSEGDKKRLAGTLLDFARSKLLYESRIEDTFPSYGQVQLIALLDCRLMLAYKPHCEVAFEIELELITKHMRLAYAFPKSRETFRSGYSSEPLLAEAAAQQFARFRRCSKSSVQDPELCILLFNCNVFSLVDPGQRWELIARHLLLLAYDKATELEYRREFPHDVKCHDLLYSRGCSVSTFIHELYRGNLAEVVMGTTPDNVESSLTFEEAFRNARVRFTHFAKLADESVATSEAMFAAFARGVAFLCTSQRQVFDFVLPVLLRDETLSESVMTCIFVTVKRRGRPRSAFKINAEKIKFFPKYESGSPEQEFDPGRRPYISMTMDLGVQDGNSPRSGFYTQVDRESTFTKRSRKTVRLEGIHDVTTENRQETSLTQRRRIMDSHPRFSIYAYGCSSAEYKVIEDRRNENYASLLQSNRHALDVQQKELAEAIRRLKPFWSKRDVFNY